MMLLDHAPRRTVLLVEDDDAIRETIAECLRAEAYEVVAAQNGADALAWLERGGRPTVVLLDVVMPVMSGTELAARLRADPAHAKLPIVLMTAGAQRDPLPVPASAFLAKPFDLVELLGAVKRVCAP